MAGLEDLMILQQLQQRQNPLYALAQGVSKGIEEGQIEMKNKKQAEEDLALQMKFDNQANTNSNKISNSIPMTIPKRTISRNEKGQRKTTLTMVRNPQLDVIDQERRAQESNERVKLLQQQTELTTQQNEKLKLEQQQNIANQEQKSQFVRDSAQDVLSSINEVKKSMYEFGVWGDVPAVPGTSKVNWRANVDKILSGKIIDVMTKMKEASKTGATGFGQLSEKELAVLTNASTALKRTLSPKDAKQYLDVMEQSFQKIVGNGGTQSTSNTGVNINYKSKYGLK